MIRWRDLALWGAVIAFFLGSLAVRAWYELRIERAVRRAEAPCR